MNTIKNRVQLMGHLGNDPELKTFESGKSKVSFQMATNEPYMVKGEWKDKTEWHRIVAWENMANRMNKNLKKGAEIIVSGRLTHQEYEDGKGDKRYITEVIADSLEVIGKRLKSDIKA